MHTRSSGSGYTLLEMSIVLLIVAVLASSVLVGLSVVRQAQMRTVVDDLDRYQQALHLFADRYHELPGDMYNAQNFWGTDPTGCPGAWDGIAKVQTCNGDGNGKISPQDYDNGVYSSFAESFRAWQQLYDAGFISSAMVGTSGPSGSGRNAVLGQNVPQTSYGGVGYLIYYLQCFTCAANPSVYFPGKYGHVIEIGKIGTAPDDYTNQPFLKPDEAQSIDTKLDDGNPATGKLTVPVRENNCLTSTNPATATYNASLHANDQCSLVMTTGL